MWLGYAIFFWAVAAGFFLMAALRINVGRLDCTAMGLMFLTFAAGVVWARM